MTYKTIVIGYTPQAKECIGLGQGVQPLLG